MARRPLVRRIRKAKAASADMEMPRGVAEKLTSPAPEQGNGAAARRRSRAAPPQVFYTVLALPLLRQLVHLLQESRIGR